MNTQQEYKVIKTIKTHPEEKDRAFHTKGITKEMEDNLNNYHKKIRDIHSMAQKLQRRKNAIDERIGFYKTQSKKPLSNEYIKNFLKLQTIGTKEKISLLLEELEKNNECYFLNFDCFDNKINTKDIVINQLKNKNLLFPNSLLYTRINCILAILEDEFIKLNDNEIKIIYKLIIEKCSKFKIANFETEQEKNFNLNTKIEELIKDFKKSNILKIKKILSFFPKHDLTTNSKLLISLDIILCNCINILFLISIKLIDLQKLSTAQESIQQLKKLIETIEKRTLNFIKKISNKFDKKLNHNIHYYIEYNEGQNDSEISYIKKIENNKKEEIFELIKSIDKFNTFQTEEDRKNFYQSMHNKIFKNIDEEVIEWAIKTTTNHIELQLKETESNDHDGCMAVFNKNEPLHDLVNLIITEIYIQDLTQEKKQKLNNFTIKLKNTFIKKTNGIEFFINSLNPNEIFNLRTTFYIDYIPLIINSKDNNKEIFRIIKLIDKFNISQTEEDFTKEFNEIKNIDEDAINQIFNQVEYDTECQIKERKYHSSNKICLYNNINQLISLIAAFYIKLNTSSISTTEKEKLHNFFIKKLNIVTLKIFGIKFFKNALYDNNGILISTINTLYEDKDLVNNGPQYFENIYSYLLDQRPNEPDINVPIGENETDNAIKKEYGTIKNFDFQIKDHKAIGEELGMMSFERAASMSGSRFVLLSDDLARFERALISFMLDITTKNGHKEISPPLLVKDMTMYKAGQLPKFTNESFSTANKLMEQIPGEPFKPMDGYRLIPTSEIPLVNIVANRLLEEKDLPIRYTACTPCFRKEAGSAGKDTSGMIRLHQFYKVELVSITTEKDSKNELEKITRIAESILEKLELPYRRVLLCTGDMGFAAAKTYDLEVWIPSQNTYREISSCSSCTDFQAKRMKTKYITAENRKIKKFVHTLNGSALAVGRLLVAILENYQNQNGEIIVPKALRKYFNSQEIIRKK